MKPQLDKYGDADRVNSDPFGFIDRDNRNHRKKLQYILDAADITQTDTILEVGCGAGLHSPMYVEAAGQYHGIDISQSLVERTREKIASGSVHVADAHDPPFSTDTFDAVVGTAILHHLHDQQRALRNWARITNPGGTITLMEPNYLFPKDTVTAHIVEEEKHKTEMAPWRLHDQLTTLKEDHSTTIQSYSIEPRLYTPPWPSSITDLWDTIDKTAEEIPVLRWAAQMLEIHIQC